jgi:hypothetical protein
MKCPHCLVEFHDNAREVMLGADGDGGWAAMLMKCPRCNKSNISLMSGPPQFDPRTQQLIAVQNPRRAFMAYPKGARRAPCPAQVPKSLAEDYKESCLVRGDSAKASAALSRRCLQNVLREAAHVKPSDLNAEIQEVLDSGALRSEIAEGLDAVRVTGNFAAHPIKSKQTGEIMDVEPGEAEWNLDVLESLFDFYFVQPGILKEKKDALNKKLAEAGKPPLK